MSEDADAHSQVADRNVLPETAKISLGMLPSEPVHAHEKFRTPAGQGETETVDRLILLVIVHLDGWSVSADPEKFRRAFCRVSNWDRSGVVNQSRASPGSCAFAEIAGQSRTAHSVKASREDA